MYAFRTRLSLTVFAYAAIHLNIGKSRSQLILSPPSALLGSVIGGTIYFNLTYSSWSTAFNETYIFPPGSLFTEAADSQVWLSTAELAINLTPLSEDLARIAPAKNGNLYTSEALLQVSNAYETQSSGYNCAQLVKNSTLYNCSVPIGLPRSFRLQVKVLKDKVTISAFVFSPWAYTYSSASPRPSVGNGVNGTAIIRNVTHSPDFFYGTDWALLQHRWCLTSVGPLNDPGFLVPFTALGNASNQAGISTSEWQKCQALYVNDPSGCSSAPRGACTQIAGGSALDQFQAFRTTKPTFLMEYDDSWSCLFVNNTYVVITDTPVFASNYRCNYQYAQLSINLTLDAQHYGFISGIPQLEVRETGMVCWVSNAEIAIVYAEVENTGSVAGRFSVVATNCTEGSVIIDPGPFTQSVQAQRLARFYFTVGSLKSTSTGLCYFTASGHGAKQAAVLFRIDISADVTYKSIFQSPSLESGLPVTVGNLITPYLNCSFEFSGDAEYDGMFLSRLINALAKAAGTQYTDIVVLSRGQVGRRKLSVTGYDVTLQIRFQRERTISAPLIFRTVIAADVQSAFRSDASFIPNYGPVRFLTSRAAEGMDATDVNSTVACSQGIKWYIAFIVMVCSFVIGVVLSRVYAIYYCRQCLRKKPVDIGIKIGDLDLANT